MTSRERARRAIEFDGPDRVPFHTFVFPGAWKRHGQALADLLNEFPDDFGNRDYRVPVDSESAQGIEEYRDDWGTLWVRRRDYTSGEVKEPAIPDWAGWRDYQFPGEAGPQHFAAVAAEASDPARDYFLLGGGGSLFQHMQHLRGPANLFVDLAQDRREVHELADRLVERMNRDNARYIEAGVVEAVLQAALQEPVRGGAECRPARMVPHRWLDLGDHGRPDRDRRDDPEPSARGDGHGTGGRANRGPGMRAL